MMKIISMLYCGQKKVRGEGEVKSMKKYKTPTNLLQLPVAHLQTVLLPSTVLNGKCN